MTAYNVDGSELFDHPDLTPEELAAGRAAVIAEREALDALIRQQEQDQADAEMKAAGIDRTVTAQTITAPTIPSTATTVTAVRTAANAAIAQLTAAANDRLATAFAEGQKDREALAVALQQLGLKE